jgi:calcium-dependent protein kinase
MQQATMSMMV